MSILKLQTPDALQEDALKNLENNEDPIVQQNESLNNKVDNKVNYSNNHVTQSDLWQSHNSLRDEQHRNEDRIARQLAESSALLQKQIADSENRMMNAISGLSVEIKHVDSQARESYNQISSRLDNMIIHIDNKFIHIDNKFSEQNKKIDAQDAKIGAFATKTQLKFWAIVVAVTLAIILVLGFATSTFYLKNTSPDNAKAIAEGATNAALNFVKENNPIKSSDKNK